MKYIIVIEDNADGSVDVQHLPNPTIAELANGIPNTQAGELAVFLQHATEVWQVTQHMDLAQAHQFVQSLVKQPAKHH